MDYLCKYKKHAFTLATDLDGTFLGGSLEARRALYAHIATHRQSIGLIFVTGRSLRDVQMLLDQLSLPLPDLMICDVGTSVHLADGSCPMQDLQEEIARRWGEGHRRVPPALAALGGLTPQEGGGAFRQSYLYAHEPSALAGKAIVDAMGFDGLLSDQRYFDVLPRGVNKGATLLQVLRRLRVSEESVLVAGDTLNDLSMLTLGLPSVAVGNSEQGLLDALSDSPRVYKAEQHGAAGILEAMRRHAQMQI